MARKAAFPQDDPHAFALRLGVARSTLQRMEQGDLSVAISHYYRAAELLGMTEGFNQLFVKEEACSMTKARLNAYFNTERIGVSASDIVTLK